MTMQTERTADLDAIEARVAAGFINKREHPSYPLDIYTYSRQCQYEARWDDVTMRCRGLVVERGTGRVVAHPFPKFFNVAEHAAGRPWAPPLPDEPFELYDKVDGSLGILFRYDDRWLAASKGSFVSEQADWATGWLMGAGDDLPPLDGVTLLAEIVYRENRIVVDHGDEGLVLLGGYDVHGVELPLRWLTQHWPGPAVAAYSSTASVDEIAARAAENRGVLGQHVRGTDAEGYVIRFASGLRVKVKFSDYVRLHRLITGVTAREVWRHAGADLFPDLDAKELGRILGCSPAEASALRAHGASALGALLDGVPDEFDEWVRRTHAGLASAYTGLVIGTQREMVNRKALHGDRAAFARSLDGLPGVTRSALFLMLDGRDPGPSIWRSLRPGPSSPFRDDEEG